MVGALNLPLARAARNHETGLDTPLERGNGLESRLLNLLLSGGGQLDDGRYCRHHLLPT